MNKELFVIRIITADCNVGYYTGFYNGYPYFISAYSRRVRVYRTRANTWRQLIRIKKLMQHIQGVPPEYEIISITNPIEWTPAL